MNQPKTKYLASIKPAEETYTIKSLLKPNLSDLDLGRILIHWYRQPPSPYQPEQLSYNFNQTDYKCTGLDFECNILCRVLNDTNQQIAKFSYGPIQTFVYGRLSPSLQIRVGVLLFGTWKKCVLAFANTPTLINPQNNNKYQLTQQDICSISFKPQQLKKNDQTIKNQLQINKTPVLNTLTRKTIVVQNLYQRLILLKLFGQITNGMYCQSTDVLEISFYDQSGFTTALLAINRFKYQKQQFLQVSKSMQNESTRPVQIPKFMKKFNEWLGQIQHQNKNNGAVKKHLQDKLKKQFFPLSALTNWKKTPKESINSANQSFVSGKSAKPNESIISQVPRTLELSKRVQQNDHKQAIVSQSNTQFNCQVSLKQPKISILSTDINSIKQARQKKQSFPQVPAATQNLKSSQLLIKPKEFKCILSLRRSQQQIKTPKMDQDDQKLCVNNAKPPGRTKKKSASEIQVPNLDDQQQNKRMYVDEFENLLFEQDQLQNKETQLCLNDSFAKLEEQEEKQKLQGNQSIQNYNTDNSNINESILQQLSSQQPSISQNNISELKHTLVSVLRQNSYLKQKNDELRREMNQAKNNGQKSSEIIKYENQIHQMKEIKDNLIKEIEEMKQSAINCNSQVLDEKQGKSSRFSHRLKEKEGLSHSYISAKNQIGRTINNEQMEGEIKREYLVNRTSESKSSSCSNKEIGNIFSPSRHSKASNQLIKKTPQSTSPSFLVRRSQLHDQTAFAARGTQQIASQQDPRNMILNSEEQRFIKLPQDSKHYEFNNGQNQSQKQTQPLKFQQKRLPKQYPFKY